MIALRLALAAFGGLLLGAAGMGMARDYLEPTHKSIVHCIATEMRGVSNNNDIAKLAVLKLCREEFPTASLDLSLKGLAPRPDLPDDLVAVPDAPLIRAP
jgi:hypothetical protein